MLVTEAALEDAIVGLLMVVGLELAARSRLRI